MTGDDTGDERIAALFRDAAADAPPSRFDHTDVVATSRRITARRRSAVLGGAMALLLVAGVGAVATLPTGGPSTSTVASADAGQDADSAGQADRAAPEAAPGAAPQAPGPAVLNGPAASGVDASAAAPSPPGSAGPSGSGAPSLGGAGSSGPPPLGPGTTACADRHDPALRALVVQVLPEAATAPDAPVGSRVCLPGTERYLNVQLGGGVLIVAYLPPGSTVSLAQGAQSAPTASGGTVIVSTPTAYRDRTDALLAYLAPRL